VLLLSRDDAYSYLNKFVVAEVTSTIRHIPVEVPLGRKEGLPKPCVANCDNLRTIPRDALKTRIATLPSTRIAEVKRAVGYALGWEVLIEER
jgi:mRNA interferase MazF